MSHSRTAKDVFFDLRPYLDRGVFERLRNPATFAAARVAAGSVEWPGGLDMSYDTLYLVSAPTTEVYGVE